MENLDLAYLNDLVLKAQQGSSNAFAELYAATYQRQYAYAYRYLRDEHLAQDALQESFIRVLKNIRQLQNPELFIAWLNQISFHVCYDMKKERARIESEISYEALPDTGGGASGYRASKYSSGPSEDSASGVSSQGASQRGTPAYAVASSAPTPEDEAVNVDMKRYILQQVESLPLTESQVILMKYYQGMELGEIADMLNVSRGTVKRYLKSARKHLEKLEF